MNKINYHIEKEKKLLELEYEFVKQFIKIRKNKNISQQKMSEKANMIRLTVSRIENLIVSPQISTIIKLLEPIGYTVKIVPIEDDM